MAKKDFREIMARRLKGGDQIQVGDKVHEVVMVEPTKDPKAVQIHVYKKNEPLYYRADKKVKVLM